MTVLRYLVAVAAGAVLAGCFRLGALPRGSVVPTSTAEPRRNELPALATELLARGDARRAFYVVELEKSQTLGSLISKRRSGPATAAVDLSKLVRLEPAAAGDDVRGLSLAPVAPLGALDTRRAAGIEQFWKEQRALDVRLGAFEHGDFPYELVLRDRFVPLTVEELMRAQARDQATLSYFVAGESVWVFVARRDRFGVKRLPVGRAELQSLANALSAALTGPRDESWRPLARRAHEALLGPLGAELRGASTLTVVPHGFLANVPFAALIGPEGKPIVRRVRVSYAPSASLYRSLTGRRLLSDRPRMLAVGDPRYPKPWPDLPSAEAEARALSRLFGGSMLLAGVGATEDRFYDVYRGFNIFHFATHGMMAGALTAEASSLVLTPSPLNDGYLTAAEIAGLDLSASYLTVLSACETATSADGAQSDLGSIAGAFLAAGTPSVVGSLWKVSDASTARLMLRFYRRFLERGTAEALRQAQVSLLDDPRTAHPYYWAAFVLNGWDK